MVHAAVFLTASVALTVFAVYHVLYTTGTTVLLDGVALGTVASEEEPLRPDERGALHLPTWWATTTPSGQPDVL